MCLNRGLCFAGTQEGHNLAILARDKKYPIDFSVATDYGEEILKDVEDITIYKGRMQEKDIICLIEKKKYEFIIDATHPFAVEVTENIKNACEKTNIKYFRYLRKSELIEEDGVILVDSIENAVSYLNTCDDRVLVTTGAKELMKYSKVKDYKDRIFPRVLPSYASIESAEKACIPSKNVICMQGPFIKELNEALMKQYRLTAMVTKDTGKTGGYGEKVECVKDGYKVIVVKRPTLEIGLDLEQITGVLKEYYGY